MADWVDSQLTFIGLKRRERQATLALVPGCIQAAMPVEPVHALFAGSMPLVGFGLGGGVGSGKTMALAAVIKGALTKFAELKGSSLPERMRGFEWCCWPEEAIWLTANAPDANARCNRLASVALLVLDDLGRERVKGAYSDDWAVSLLDSVVSRRNRECLPTIWTSNVPEADLVALYGASFVSRLTQDNPLIWVESGPAPR